MQHGEGHAVALSHEQSAVSIHALLVGLFTACAPHHESDFRMITHSTYIDQLLKCFKARPVKVS